MVSNTDRITILESNVARMQKEAEANCIENAMQFQEMMKAISNLSLAVGKMKTGAGKMKNIRKI